MLRRLTERRALSFQTVWGSGGDWVGGSSLAGVPIAGDNALRVSAVYSCVRLYTDCVSTLPADAYLRIDGDRRPYRPKPAWIDEPSPGVTRSDHFAQVMVSLLIDGNSFTHVLRSPTTGEVIDLTVLNPQHVEVRRSPSREIEYVVGHGKVIIPASDMIHITEMTLPGELRGVSRIAQNKETLGLAQALTEFAARFFGQGSMVPGVIEWPGSLTKEQAVALVDTFEASHQGLTRSHRPAVLQGGAQFKATGIDPESSQLNASRRQSVEDVARIFRVPPHMLGITDGMTYSNVENNAIQWVRFSVVPIVTKIEQAYSRLLPGVAFLRFNLDSLLRGDTSTRFAAYSTALQSGFMSVNEVRRLEDLRTVDAGEALRVPLANVDLNAANLTETEKKVAMARNLVLVGYDPAEVLAAMGLPAIEHTGVPSSQLQPVAQIDPNDPGSVY